MKRKGGGRPNPYMKIMEDRMQACVDASVVARNQIPPSLNSLRIVLQMPNLIRILANISKFVEYKRLLLGYRMWKDFSKIRSFRRVKSLKLIQTNWRVAVDRRQESRKNAEAETQRLQRVFNAATIVKLFVRKRAILMRIKAAIAAKHNRSATRIQKLFRGYRTRGLLVDEKRIQLVREIRDWAQGCSDKLLTNPYLRDLQSRYLVSTVIALSTTPSRPLRGLPPMKAFKEAIAMLRSRRKELEDIHFHEKFEHARLMSERHGLLLEDHRSLLIEKYLKALEVEAQRILEEKKQQQHREKMEYVKKIKRKAAALKLMGAEQEAFAEKKERENMFREDYSIRRYYDFLAARKKKTDNTNWEVMANEDKLGHMRRAAEQEAEAWRAMIASEVILAVKAQVAPHSKSLAFSTLVQASSSNRPERPSDGLPVLVKSTKQPGTSVKTKDTKETRSKKLSPLDTHHSSSWPSPSDNLGETIEKWKSATMKRHFHEWDCNINISMLSSFIKSVQFSLRFQDGSSSQANETFALTSAKYTLDAKNRERFYTVLHFRSARDARAQSYKDFSSALRIFKMNHTLLIEVRHRLRQLKIPTRQQRQQLLTQASQLETSLLSLVDEMRDSKARLMLDLQQEMIQFNAIFSTASADPCHDLVAEDAEEQRAAEEEKLLHSHSKGGKDKGSLDTRGKRVAALSQEVNKKAKPVEVAVAAASKKGVEAKGYTRNRRHTKVTPKKIDSPETKKSEIKVEEKVIPIESEYWDKVYCQNFRPGEIPEPPEPFLYPGMKFVATAEPVSGSSSPLPSDADSLSRNTSFNSSASRLKTRSISPSITGSPKTSKSQTSSIVSNSPPTFSVVLVNEASKSSSFNVPGLTHFLQETNICIPCVAYGNKLVAWIKVVLKWMQSKENIWRIQHKTVIVSSLQRLHCVVENSLPTDFTRHGVKKSTAHRTSKSHASAANNYLYRGGAEEGNFVEGSILACFHALDVSDAYELLLYRNHLLVKFLDVSGCSELSSVILTSGNLDRHLGFHPISATAIALLLTSTSFSKHKESCAVRVLSQLVLISMRARLIGIGKQSFNERTFPPLMTILSDMIKFEKNQIPTMVRALVAKKILLFGHLAKTSTSNKVLQVIKRIEPTRLAKHIESFDYWALDVPVWMQPAYRWGKVASPEPFWRRLQYEKRNGIEGEYTKIDRKDCRVEVAAKRWVCILMKRVLLRKALANALKKQHCIKVDRECMCWEDALSTRRRQVDRLARAQREEQRQSTNFSISKLFSICLPMASAAKISHSAIKPSDDWHNSYLARRAPYQYFDHKSCYQVDMGDSSATLSQLDAKDREYLASLHRHVEERMSKSARLSSWVTGEAVYFDSHGHHCGPRQESVEWSFQVHPAETWCFGGFARACIAVRVLEDENVNPRGYLRLSTFLCQPPSYSLPSPTVVAPVKKPSSTWSRQPSTTAKHLTAHSKVDSFLLNMKESLFQPGKILVHCRTGFASARYLCNDDHKRGEFASYITNVGRPLSIEAFKRLRTQQVSKELPLFEDLCEKAWDEVLMDRYSGEGKTVRIVQIQCMLRVAMARRRVASLRAAKRTQSHPTHINRTQKSKPKESESILPHHF